MKLADLLEEFNVVIDTAEGLNELRSLILGLAVRGKLVPQDPEDEPASELLKKIEAERQRQYDEGLIRKPKVFDEVTPKDSLKHLPNNWKQERLGNLTTVITKGSTPTTYGFQYVNEGINFVKIENIDDQRINLDTIQQFLSVRADDKLSRSRLKVDDLLYGIAGSIGTVAIVEEKDIPANTNQALAIIRGYDKALNKNFLIRVLNSPVATNVNEKARGGAMNNISLTDLGNLVIPLPPLAEQHRIVQKIESLFAEVDELEAKLNRQGKLDEKLQMAVNAEVQKAPDTEASKYAWNFITSNFDTLYHSPETIDNLKKNILNEAVRGRLVPQNPNDEPASELLKEIEAEKQRLYDEGEIRKPKDLSSVEKDEHYFDAPSNWKWIRLGEIGDWGAGATPTRSNSEYYGGVIPWLKTGELNDSIINKAEEFITEKGFQNSSVRLCQPGDILIAMYGATIGKLGILEFEATTNQACCACTTFKGFYNIYLYYYLLSMRDNFRSQGAGGAQPNISKTKIENTVLPLPPLEEQHRIVQRIEELFAICDRFKAQLEQRQGVNERLVKGLVKEVLEGAGSSEKEPVHEEEISVAAEPENIYQISKKPTNVDYYKRTVLAAEIVWQLHDQPTLGHVKLQKIIYLAQQTSNMMLPTNFIKQAAGPYDPQMARSIDKQLKQKKWFEFHKGEFLKYKPLEKAGEHQADFDKYFYKEKENIQFLIDTFKKAKTDKVEIIATLFACWKELIEEGKTVSDDLLIEQFYNWSKEKAKFTQERLVKAINWMRAEGIMPIS